MKQKVSNPSETFTVTNRKEEDVYGISVNSIDNELFITIHNPAHEQVAVVTNKHSKDDFQFSVAADNEKVFTIEKRLSPVTSDYVVTGDKLHLDSDFFDMSFNIMFGYRKVAKVRNRWTTRGESYEITVFEDENEAAIVGLVSVLDFIKNNEKKKSNVI